MSGKNPMKNPHIVKCVVNIGVGKGGEELRKARKVIEMVTGQEPVDTISKITNADLDVREDQPVGTKVTLRGTKAYEFLKEAFWVKEDMILEDSFDEYGNFSFGISDYTDFKGKSYNPNIGIFGMDISVELARKGQRVKRRVKQPKRIPDKHRLTKQEGIDFVEKAFGVEVLE